MIDPKLLSTFSDAEIARVKTAISHCDPRHLHILEGLDQPFRLKYLLANSESERIGIRREYWMEKFSHASSGIKGLSLLPLATLGFMAVYPGAEVSATEATALCAMSAAMAGTAGIIEHTKSFMAKKIVSAIGKKAAQYAPQAMEPLPVASDQARIPDAQTLSSLAGISRRMHERSPQEREICQLVGRVISRHNGALAKGVEMNAAEQIETLQNLRGKVDEFAAINPMGARECEHRLAEALRSYGMSLPPSPTRQASMQERGGLAFGV